MSLRIRHLIPAFILLAFLVISLPLAITRLPVLLDCSSRDVVFCSLVGQNMLSMNMAKSITTGINAEAPGSAAPPPVRIAPKDLNLTTRVQRSMFPKDFVWGTATAAYQVEGAFNEGGRGPSIWDTFSKKPGKTVNGDTGDVACDQYHRYKEDVELMENMGVHAYRFSISWSRLFPTGEGELNAEGVAYYNKLIDELLLKGLQPYVTLFHWDLPQALQDRFGGWLDERIVPCFRDYAEACFANFGDRVKHWITFNEPLTFSSVGYAYGVHAPGRCSDRSRCEEGNSATEPYLVGHNILRSHAAAVEVFRTKYQQQQNGKIGITVDSDWSEPATNKVEDIAAAQRRMEFQLGWMLDPIFKGDYPQTMRHQVGARLPTFSPAELAQLSGSLDFVGLNHYTSRWVTHGQPPKDENSSDNFQDQWLECASSREGVAIGLRAASEWLYIVPWGLGKLITWVDERYQPASIFITENGMDEVDDPSLPLEEALRDPLRVQFYNDYLLSVAEAIGRGAKVKGYFAWSLLDNFEWAMGYSRRFGLHYVDYKDGLKRYPKDSAKWWKEFLREA
eukprot:TRINITY_DN19424_c0_g1_i1.p1 TRINITY_DN19424_c0_g1~~TRINITY_DN19424_c0_g1_i1.p1  ORF type:complete len:563 (-),score=70.11 TRINITY_DN19424_c0_g1_i1:367-2055(-)